MAKNMNVFAAGEIKMDKSDGSFPQEATLLKLAKANGVLEKAATKEGEFALFETAEEEYIEPPRSSKRKRFAESLLWSICLVFLHLTFEVLVQHQYAVGLVWPKLIKRAAVSFPVWLLLVFVLHPHQESNTVIRGLPYNWHTPIRNTVFFWTSVIAGCYLIWISNESPYLAVMKQAPPVGCLWVWSIIELDLGLSVGSLLGCAGFFWYHGFSLH